MKSTSEKFSGLKLYGGYIAHYPKYSSSSSQGSHNTFTQEPLTESSIKFDAELSCVIFILSDLII